MKYKVYHILTILGLICSFTSCKKFLDRPPQGQLTQSEAFHDEAGLAAFANGIYTYIGDDQFLGGRVQNVSEMLADEIDGSKLTGDYAEIYGRRNSIFGGTRDDLYTKGYRAINSANIVLENLELATTKKSYLEGEAKLFRGIAHFELVRLFAQPYGYTGDNSQPGIPLRLTSAPVGLQRATVKEVYDQVISDLKAADSLLPATTADGTFHTATKWAAEAYLAKVYFQMNDFADAYTYADQVISSGKFTLDNNYFDRFSLGGSKEGILTIASETNHFTPGGELRNQWRSDKSLPTLRFTDQFYNYATSDPADTRDTAFYSNTLQAGANVLTKYNKDFFELPIVHLTEIKLIRAEAGAEISGSNAGALTVAIADINDILTRAYGGTSRNLSLSSTAASVITEARKQRELEMVGEGNRLQEIKRIGVRNGTNIDRRGSQWNCNGFILQFPKGEQDAYAPFKLNPEGGCF